MLVGMQSGLDGGEFGWEDQMKGSLNRLSGPHRSEYERGNCMRAVARYTVAYHLTAHNTE